MTDTPEPTGPTPFFAPTPAADEPAGASAPAPLAPVEPAPPSDETPAPASVGGHDEPALEELLRDVRGALATLPGEPGDISYPPLAPPPGLADLQGAVADLRAAVAELHDAQRAARAEVTAQLDTMARQLATDLGAELSARVMAAAPSTPAADDVTLQDLHDGLAGVRTDVAGLPDLLGPAVTSAVGHGIAGPTRQLEAVTTALADSSLESGQLRAELAGLQVQLAALHEQASLLPQVQAGLREVTDRLADLESLPAPPPAPPMPDVSAIVDERLAEHLTAFGGGLGERLDAQLVSIQGTLGSIPRDDVAARLDGTERRLAQQLDAMRAADTTDERLSQVEQRLVDRVAVLDRQLAAQVQLTEQRLVRHVDEAVLALASAVLIGSPAVTEALSADDPSSPLVSQPPPQSFLEPPAAAFEPTPFAEPDLSPAPDVTELPAMSAPPELPELPDPPGPPADLEPVPVYGTANLGLAPPAPAAEPDSDTELGMELDGGGDPIGGVEAWAKGDDRYAELPHLEQLEALPADVPEAGDEQWAPPTADLADEPWADDAPPHESPDVPAYEVPDDVLPDAPAAAPPTRKGLFRRKG